MGFAARGSGIMRLAMKSVKHSPRSPLPAASPRKSAPDWSDAEAVRYAERVDKQILEGFNAHVAKKRGAAAPAPAHS